MKVKINNLDYDIEITENKFTNHWGTVDYDAKTIYINKKATENDVDFVSTLFHEWVHVWLTDMAKSDNEELVCLIESIFRDFYTNYLIKNIGGAICGS